MFLSYSTNLTLFWHLFKLLNCDRIFEEMHQFSKKITEMEIMSIELKRELSSSEKLRRNVW
jgi:hypothetical protein